MPASPNRTECPKCNTPRNYKDQSEGTVARCANCGHKFKLTQGPISPIVWGFCLLVWFGCGGGCLWAVFSGPSSTSPAGPTSRATSPGSTARPGAEAPGPQDGGHNAAGPAVHAAGGGKDVHVDGYQRKDGSYVKPHERAAPGQGGGRKR
jgi:hypothetical protein